MARAPKSTPVVESKSRAVTNWDEELAKAATIQGAMESKAAGGEFYSFKAGVLSFGGAPIKDNTVYGIVIASILENVYYPGAYDANNPTPPQCYAFGNDVDTMAPYTTVITAGQAQHEDCAGCHWNEWGTAATGRGKACRNMRRLVVLEGGEVDDKGRFKSNMDVEHWTKFGGRTMKLPPTSVKPYANYVISLTEVAKRPTWGFFTKIQVVADAQTQFKVLFSTLGEVPHALLPVVRDRSLEAAATIVVPYPLLPEAKPEPRGRGGRQAAVAPKGRAPVTGRR